MVASYMVIYHKKVFLASATDVEGRLSLRPLVVQSGLTFSPLGKPVGISDYSPAGLVINKLLLRFIVSGLLLRYDSHIPYNGMVFLVEQKMFSNFKQPREQLIGSEH